MGEDDDKECWPMDLLANFHSSCSFHFRTPRVGAVIIPSTQHINLGLEIKYNSIHFTDHIILSNKIKNIKICEFFFRHQKPH